MESAAGVTVAAVDVVVQQLDEFIEEDDEDAADGTAGMVSAAQAAAIAGMPAIG